MPMKNDPGQGFEVGIVEAQPAVNEAPLLFILPFPPLLIRVWLFCHNVGGSCLPGI